MAPIDSKPPSGVERQFFIRYWWVIKGYDVGYVDVFIALDQPPRKEVASKVVDRALLASGWLQLNLEATYPADLTPLYRNDQGLVWDWDSGLQDPVIVGPPGQALVRRYRIRDVSGQYPHMSAVHEKWVDRGRLL